MRYSAPRHPLVGWLALALSLVLTALSPAFSRADGPPPDAVPPLANAVPSNLPASVVAVANDGLTLDRAILPAALQAGQPWSSPSALPRQAMDGGRRGLEDVEMEGQRAGASLLRPDFVIGGDNRTRVTTTNSYPWSAIVHLEMTFPRGSGTCTGWLIGRHTVATAGHCVYGADEGGWATRIRVIPGRNSSQMPFGAVYATRVWAARDWVATEAPPADYGAIKIGTDLGTQAGWFGFRADSDATLQGVTLNTAGYPGDKPFGTQWFTTGRVTSLSRSEVYFDLDIWSGQSGSPAWRRVGDTRTVVAIVAYGSRPYNFGTRITDAVASFLAAALQD
ncbi:MAG: trypsin-like serine protease [Anaerolineae bacterium]|nr:trypsin-like serine protease [Anaerolineae bacterium]